MIRFSILIIFFLAVIPFNKGFSDARFVVLEGTNTMWQRNETSKMTFQSAVDYCEKLDLEGYKDWRLPPIQVLNLIVDTKKRNPSGDKTMFPGLKSNIYWSASPNGHDNAFCADFNDGNLLSENTKNLFHVRCFRIHD